MSRDDYFMEHSGGLHVDLWYPRSEDRPQFIQIGLVDVRAVPDIRLRFDFDRNGWAIECQVLDEREGCLLPPDSDDGPVEWRETGLINPQDLVRFDDEDARPGQRTTDVALAQLLDRLEALESGARIDLILSMTKPELERALFSATRELLKPTGAQERP